MGYEMCVMGWLQPDPNVQISGVGRASARHTRHGGTPKEAPPPAHQIPVGASSLATVTRWNIKDPTPYFVLFFSNALRALHQDEGYVRLPSRIPDRS